MTIDAKPGSIIIFNSWLFHTFSRNKSNSKRCIINNVFGLPIFKQQINIPGFLKDKYKLNSKLKKILGYNWDPPQNVIQFIKNKLKKSN